MKYLMGIDNGGTFSKAAIFDEDGKQISVASFPTVTLTPRPGYTERDLDELWNVNVRAIRTAIENSGIDPALIAAVSFSGHGKGLYMLQADGRPAYNGILSQDARAWQYVERWNADGTAQKVFAKSFQKILVMQHVSLLAWFRDHLPEVLQRTAHIFAVKDFVRFRLTGEAFAEYSDFTGSNLVNLSTGAYDPEHLALFGLESILPKLPPLRHAADLCGHITPEASALTLLPIGTPVAAGMFDVDACGLASGLSDSDQLCMIAGTWSINEFIAPAPITNGSVALNSMFAIPGSFLVEESSPTSAGNLEWFIQNLLSMEKIDLKAQGRSIYALANEWVASIPPQECNLVYLPFLHGSSDHPLAKATFIGLTAFHNKKHMLRAVFEGVVFSHWTHVQRLLQNRSLPRSIRLSGGAANSDLWVQIFADTMQIPIDVIEDKEIGAAGAAIAAGIAAGIYPDYPTAIARTVKITKTIQPRPEFAPLYARKFQVYRAVIDALNPVWLHFEN